MFTTKNGSYVRNTQSQEFYVIATNSDRKLNSVPKSFQSIGIKKGQSVPTTWQRLGKISMFSMPSSFFLNITTFLKETVTIHGRNKKQ